MTSEEAKRLIPANQEKEIPNYVEVTERRAVISSITPGPLRLYLFFRSILNFPISIWFIVGNEFCERFSYYGMRAVLVLYFVYQLRFSQNDATALYHLVIFLAYFVPVFGSMIADSYIGKYLTILIFSILYFIGSVSLCLSAVLSFVGDILQIRIALCIIGLLLIALGTGGIKSCVSAFGGDQVKQGDETILSSYFSLFYFAINSGSLISIFLTPILRTSVQCFGADCYAASFGLPAVLMLCSIILFVAGNCLYIKVPPTKRNLYLEIFRIILYAIRRRIEMRKSVVKKDHWLDWAVPKYDPSLVYGIKAIVKVFYMFLPLPIFWALFEQQGSRWLLQATSMDTSVGTFTIHPDQIQVLNPILILVLIPIFDKIVYPLIRLCKIKVTTLRRMTSGIFLAGVAFIISGVLQIQIVNGSDLSAPNSFAFLKIINPTANQANVTVYSNSTTEYPLNFTVNPEDFIKELIPAGRYNVSFPIKEQKAIEFHTYDIQLNSSLTCTIFLSNLKSSQATCTDMNLYRPDVIKYQASIQLINSLPEQTLFKVREELESVIEANLTILSKGQSGFFRIPIGDYFLDFSNHSLPFQRFKW